MYFWRCIYTGKERTHEKTKTKHCALLSTSYTYIFVFAVKKDREANHIRMYVPHILRVYILLLYIFFKGFWCPSQSNNQRQPTNQAIRQTFNDNEIQPLSEPFIQLQGNDPFLRQCKTKQSICHFQSIKFNQSPSVTQARDRLFRFSKRRTV